MIPILAARRRADEFDVLLRGADRSSAHPDLAALARVANGLVTVGATNEPPSMSQAAVADLRARLLTEADEVLLPMSRGPMSSGPMSSGTALSSDPRHPRTRRDRRLAVAAGAIVAVGASASVAVASQDAVPGDTLYPIKRLVEDVRTTMHLDDTARGESQLEVASVRLDELSDLAAGDGAESDLERALIDFRADTDEAARTLIARHDDTGELTPLVTLDEFTSSSLNRLSTIGASLPAGVMPELGRATRLLEELDVTVSALCSKCAATPLDIPRKLLDVLGATATDGQPPSDSSDVPDLSVAPTPELIERNTTDEQRDPDGQAPPPERDFAIPNPPAGPDSGDSPVSPDLGAPPVDDDGSVDDPVKKLKETVEEDIPVVSPLTRDLLDGIFRSAP